MDLALMAYSLRMSARTPAALGLVRLCGHVLPAALGPTMQVDKGPPTFTNEIVAQGIIGAKGVGHHGSAEFAQQGTGLSMRTGLDAVG